MTTIVSALMPNASQSARDEIADTLVRFGIPMLGYLADSRIRIYPLHDGELYHTASPGLTRLGINPDAWLMPPAGLFVPMERIVYLRNRDPMTVSHELGHAVDCALGNGMYFSVTDPDIAKWFRTAPGYVTPYAGTRLDEYFAEAVRAYVEANVPTSPWPAATRARLKTVDPNMYTYVASTFQHINGHEGKDCGHCQTD